MICKYYKPKKKKAQRKFCISILVLYNIPIYSTAVDVPVPVFALLPSLWTSLTVISVYRFYFLETCGCPFFRFSIYVVIIMNRLWRLWSFLTALKKITRGSGRNILRCWHWWRRLDQPSENREMWYVLSTFASGNWFNKIRLFISFNITYECSCIYSNVVESTLKIY